MVHITDTNNDTVLLKVVL